MYKKYFCLSIFIFIIPVFFALFFLHYLAMHSFQTISKGYYDTRFYTVMRYQIPAITQSIEFDSIILGSSFLENSSAQEAQNLLGGNWVNISLSAQVLILGL